MAIYAISDLHLSLETDKPMDIFGWGDHTGIIRENWTRKIRSDDFVLIPGDISWGMDLKEADPDFAFLESLPGYKILGKGNHDYWWSTRRKFERYCAEKGYRTLMMLHNNMFEADGYVICGSRGWKPADDDGFSEEDLKVYRRELERVKNSLNEGKKTGKKIIAMLHYPPFDTKHRPNDFSALLREFGATICVYGHIHSRADESWKNEIKGNIRYHLVSCNIIGFDPVKIV